MNGDDGYYTYVFNEKKKSGHSHVLTTGWVVIEKYPPTLNQFRISLRDEWYSGNSMFKSNNQKM